MGIMPRAGWYRALCDSFAAAAAAFATLLWYACVHLVACLFRPPSTIIALLVVILVVVDEACSEMGAS